MASHTSRTMDLLRERGYKCGVVERFNRFVGGHGIRIDLFGFVDLIAIKSGERVIGVQSCGDSFSQHRQKILKECREDAITWLDTGARILLVSWKKKRARKGARLLWTPREEFISLPTLGLIRPPKIK